MRLNWLVFTGGLAVLGLAALLWISGGFTALSSFALTIQREAQSAMAGSLRALRQGDPAALFTLMALAAGYGFFHAIGPGHGKVLLGGAAFAGRVSVWRMIGLSVASGLAQATAAILLVYGALALVTASARPLTDLADQWLAPASYALIAGVGFMMVLRGLRLLSSRAEHHHHAGCKHAHGPSAEQAAGAKGWRDTCALILSIAIRPCSGAIILLFIAWQLDIAVAGFLAVIAMGLGTAAFNAVIAAGAVLTRESVLIASGSSTWLMPGLQIVAGISVALIALGFLIGTLSL